MASHVQTNFSQPALFEVEPVMNTAPVSVQEIQPSSTIPEQYVATTSATMAPETLISEVAKVPGFLRSHIPEGPTSYDPHIKVKQHFDKIAEDERRRVDVAAKHLARFGIQDKLPQELKLAIPPNYPEQAHAEETPESNVETHETPSLTKGEVLALMDEEIHYLNLTSGWENIEYPLETMTVEEYAKLIGRQVF